MTPLKVSALATESCSVNSTKAKRVGWVSSPAIRTNFTLPTCLKNSRSCSAVVVCGRKGSSTASVRWPWTRGRLFRVDPRRSDVHSYLRVQVAHIDGSPDLINLCWVHIAHEGRLRGHRCCDLQTGWHPTDYWKVELQGKTPSSAFSCMSSETKMKTDSHSGGDLEQEWVAAPHWLSDWALARKVPKVTKPWPPLGFCLQDRETDLAKEVEGFFCLLYACTISPLYSREKERIDFHKQPTSLSKARLSIL